MFAFHPVARLKRFSTAFLVGGVAVLFIHQPTIGLVHELGLTALTPYSLRATQPWGVPIVLSLSFWGGMWAIPIVWTLDQIPRGRAYWVSAALLGSLPTTLASIFIILPLRGLPIGAFSASVGIMAALTANGVWGLGIAALLTGIDWTLARHRARPLRD